MGLIGALCQLVVVLAKFVWTLLGVAWAIMQFTFVVACLVALAAVGIFCAPFEPGRRLVRQGFLKLCDWVIFDPKS